MSSDVYVSLPSLKWPQVTWVGTSPYTLQGRGPESASPFKRTQGAISVRIFSWGASSVPSGRSGKFIGRLPFLLTISASIWITVVAVLYWISRLQYQSPTHVSVCQGLALMPFCTPRSRSCTQEPSAYSPPSLPLNLQL